MGLQFPTRAERPGSQPHASGLEGAWPEFMYHDAVLNRLFGRVIDELRRVPVLRLGRRARGGRRRGERDPRSVGRRDREPARRRSRRRRRSRVRRRSADADRPLRAADPDRSRLPRPGSQQPHDRANGRDRPAARSRDAHCAGAAEPEASLSARPDRALHRVAPRRRRACRPVAANARATRSRDRQGRPGVDACARVGRRVGGMDGDGVSRERRLRRPGCARARRDRSRTRTKGSTWSRTSGWCTRQAKPGPGA